MHRLVVVVALATGCNAYMSVGMDTGAKITGGLAQPMKQTVIADPRIAAAAAVAGIDTSGSTEPSVGKTYSLAVGWAISQFQLGIDVQAHDVDRSTFSFSTDTRAPRYVTATGSFDLTWTPLRWKMFSTFIHAGPSYGVLVERTSGNVDTGKGLRFGGGVSVGISGVAAAFIDVYQMELEFDSGAAQGMSQISGATVGIGFNR